MLTGRRGLLAVTLRGALVKTARGKKSRATLPLSALQDVSVVIVGSAAVGHCMWTHRLLFRAASSLYGHCLLSSLLLDSSIGLSSIKCFF